MSTPPTLLMGTARLTLYLCNIKVKKVSPYSITKRMVPELIPVLGMQSACR